MPTPRRRHVVGCHGAHAVDGRLRKGRTVQNGYDMMIIHGVNCLPRRWKTVLMRIEGTPPHYQIVIERGAAHFDEVEVEVEMERAVFSHVTRVMEQLRKRIHNELKSELGISAPIKRVEPRLIERSDAKAQRIIDKRSL